MTIPLGLKKAAVAVLACGIFAYMVALHYAAIELWFPNPYEDSDDGLVPGDSNEMWRGMYVLFGFFFSMVAAGLVWNRGCDAIDNAERCERARKERERDYLDRVNGKEE